MSYILVHTEILVAKEKIRDDAMKSYFDRNAALRQRDLPTSLKHINDIVLIVKHKSGVIETGKEYVYREFVDENGEAFFLNSGIETDKVAIRNNFYPQIVSNQIK